MDAKTRILKSGAKIIHRKGFHDAGLQEILDEANVPKGSFYFYFKNKEDFGLAVIDYFADYFLRKADEFLSVESGNYLKNLKRYFAWQADMLIAAEYQGGCPFGKLAQEMADRNDRFRQKLESVFYRLKSSMADDLAEAMESGEIDPDLDVQETAEFILNAWQGTLMQMKVLKTDAPRKAFNDAIFGRLMKNCRTNNNAAF